jgi:hypothetical protein
MAFLSICVLLGDLNFRHGGKTFTYEIKPFGFTSLFQISTILHQQVLAFLLKVILLGLV